ncbi:MAG: ParB/RepB/Spo0J family partition protein [Saprospiraceae bacterium]|nr:ParB/RepB/Spo0J family partition protein [Saprospiraceae bacterium]
MAKVPKQELGKGIRALLGSSDALVDTKGKKKKAGQSGMATIGLRQIETNPYQPRNDFDEEALHELAESIKTFGLIQPVTLRKLDGEKFQLISGERRYRASKIAGLQAVPAYIRTANDQEMLEMALVENIQRADLNAIEVAISYQRLIDECSLTHESLSDRIGKNRSTVTNYIRLLNLPPALQQALKRDKISMGHARALLSIDSKDGQLLALQRVLLDGLSVRATEKLVKSYSHPQVNSPTPTKDNLTPLHIEVRDHLSRKWGTKVQMKRKASGVGQLIINFKSDEELNRLLDEIEGN